MWGNGLVGERSREERLKQYYDSRYFILKSYGIRRADAGGQQIELGLHFTGRSLGMFMKIKNRVILTLVCGLFPLVVKAEEAGSGHYLPGAMASFIDALPGRESFAYLNAFTYYNGSAGGSRQLSLGGQITSNIQASFYADTSFFLVETKKKLFGGNYAAAVAVPYVWMSVSGDVKGSGPFGGSQALKARDSNNGIGDMQFLPFMLGWNHGDLKLGTSLGMYAPTGDYARGQLANLGKNYWTFEPGVNLSWLSSKIGKEVSLFAGYDVSTKNNATEYQSGQVLHLDGTLAQHLPLFGGFVGVGANGFYYQQTTADTGSGARLGDFEGRTMGIGPVLSFTKKVGRSKKTDLVFEAKWLPELDVTKRLSGDIVWVKLALVF